MNQVPNVPVDGEAGDRRAAQDELICAALAAGRSYEQAGTAAGVSTRTVRRRMSDARFAGQVRARRAERASRLSAGLLELGDHAIGVLAVALDDVEVAVRLRAAQLTLALGQRYRREVEMADRIAALEQRLDIALGVSGSTPDGEDHEVA